MLRKSGIKHKKGVCVDCPPGSPEKILIGDRCQFHYWNYRQKVNTAKERETRVERSAIIADVPRGTMLLCDPILDGTLQSWFEYWMLYCGRCEETNEFISKGDRDGLFASQAHILPKAHFKSVATVLDNHITLSARNGSHSRFDKSWESAQKMKVWPIAVERFRMFCHLIAPKELRRLPDVLRVIYEEVMMARSE